jgi:hypothetical protein
MSTEIPVADRLDIQELVARYAFRCDTKRYAEISELFAPDGVWDGSAIRILGYYADDYVKVDGQWLFARRTLVEIAPTTGLSGPAAATGSL